MSFALEYIDNLLIKRFVFVRIIPISPLDMSVQARIKQFINYKRITKTSFCDSIGVSNSYVSSMRRSIAPEKIQSIALIFPELSISWLLTGEGEMLNQSDIGSFVVMASTPLVLADDPNRQAWEIFELKKIIIDLKGQLAASLAKNEKLIEEVAVLRYRVAHPEDHSRRRSTA